MYALNQFKDFSLIFFTELNVNPHPPLKTHGILETSEVLQWSLYHWKRTLKNMAQMKN